MSERESGRVEDRRVVVVPIGGGRRGLSTRRPKRTPRWSFTCGRGPTRTFRTASIPTRRYCVRARSSATASVRAPNVSRSTSVANDGGEWQNTLPACAVTSDMHYDGCGPPRHARRVVMIDWGGLSSRIDPCLAVGTFRGRFGRTVVPNRPA